MISGKIQQMIDEMPAEIAGDLNFSTEEFEKRYKATRVAMKKKELDILLICGSSEMFNSGNGNLQYYTGPNVDGSLGLNFAVIPANGREFLVTAKGPQLYAFLSTYPRIPIEPSISQPKEGTFNVPDHAANIIKCVKDAGLKKGRIGVASLSSLPSEVYIGITQAFPDCEVIDVAEMVNDLRRVKSEEEIIFLRRSAFIADVGMEALVEYVRPGVSINQCIQVVDNAMVAAGAPAKGFLNIGGGTFPDLMELNFRGSPYRFQLGDIVTNELTSAYKGYYTQLARPISLGTEPNEAFRLFTKVNEEVYNQLFSKYRKGAKIRSDLDNQGNTLAQAISDGVWGAPFSCQTVDIEQSFHQVDIKLQPGICHILMPWMCQTKNWDGIAYFPSQGNWVGHAWGNTIVCTDNEPLVLHQTPMDIVVKTEFPEVLSVPSLPRDPVHGPGGTWKVSFALPIGMQEKEIRATESGAFMDGKPIPFVFDDGSVEFELTVGTPRGPMPLAFKGWMIGDEIAGAFHSKVGPVKGQRNRFKAVR